MWNACLIHARGDKLIDRKDLLDLDDFGFPVISLTNRLLVQQSDFGESREALEKSWHNWLNHQPFDAPVARRLAQIYSRHIAQLDPRKDAGAVERLGRKLRQTETRAERYAEEAFAADRL